MKRTSCLSCMYCATVQIYNHRPRRYCSFHNARLRRLNVCRKFVLPKT